MWRGWGTAKHNTFLYVSRGRFLRHQKEYLIHPLGEKLLANDEHHQINSYKYFRISNSFSDGGGAGVQIVLGLFCHIPVKCQCCTKKRLNCLFALIQQCQVDMRLTI